MGRPTKRTPELVRKICDSVEKGASNKAAALANGIVESTFQLWMQDPKFSEAIARSRARAVIRAEHAVFGGNALTWLQRGPGRRFAADEETWNDITKVELSGEVKVNVDDARQRMERILDKLTENDPED